MSMNSELCIVLVVLGLILSAGMVYLVRVALGGFQSYGRVDLQGGSILLNKPCMNFAVWLIEPIVKVLNRLSVSPDQVTAASLLFGLASAWLIVHGYFGFAFCCALISGVLDILDGMLARMMEKSDLSGVVFDSTVDRYVDFFLLAGCALLFRHEFWALLACLLALHGSYMISYTTAKAEAMSVTIPRGAMKRSERYLYLLIGLVLSALAEHWPAFWKFDSLPLLVVIWFVAFLSNWSAIMRFRSLFLIAREE